MSNALDDTWYRIRIDFECTADGYMGLTQYHWKVFINDMEFGEYAFRNNQPQVDWVVWFTDIASLNYYQYIDAIGYSWDSDYTIDENKYPNIEIVDSNLLSSDKYEFNLDGNGNPVDIFDFDDNIYKWDSIETDSYDVYIDLPSLPCDKSENINGVNIIGGSTGHGIKNDTLNINHDKINITFGIDFNQMRELNSHFNVSIKSLNGTEIIRLLFDTTKAGVIATGTNGTSHLLYYDGNNYHSLVNITNMYMQDWETPYPTIYNFNLYLENYTVILTYHRNGIFNDSFSFPLIYNLTGISSIEFLVYDNTANTNYLIIRINHIGIYQYSISLTREYGFVKYGYMDDWVFSSHNIFNVITNQTLKILGYEYYYSPSETDYYIVNDFYEGNFTYNLYEIEGSLTKPYLYFITKTYIDVNDISFSIEGIQLNKYINNVFSNEITIQYYFHNVNINQSYYYVDSSNRLHYQMSITQNDTWEYMILYFDFARHISSNNMSIYFKCRELSVSIGKPYIAMTYYQPPDNKFYLKTYSTTINQLLIEGKEFRRFHFISNDLNNNNYTNFISEGYLYGLQFNYVPTGFIPLPYDFTLLGLMEIMIALIILIVPTIGIYSVYRKKEIIIPVLLLMAIICFSGALIPFELFFMMLICFGCGIFLQLKYKKRV